VTPDFIAPFSQKQGVSPPSTSACEEYRELIEQGLARDAMAKRSGKTWSPTTVFPVTIKR
jgi:hypothetical protein